MVRIAVSPMHSAMQGLEADRPNFAIATRNAWQQIICSSTSAFLTSCECHAAATSAAKVAEAHEKTGVHSSTGSVYSIVMQRSPYLETCPGVKQCSMLAAALPTLWFMNAYVSSGQPNSGSEEAHHL